MLAREVGLLVPDVAACEFADETYAGSARVEDAVRNIEPWLRRRQRVGNFEDLFSAAVVDIWLANKDRNIGNVLGDPRLGRGKLELVFIDFEKSQALRQYPTVSTPMLEPRQLWPSGVLGHELRLQKPLLPPIGIIEQIHSVTIERCAEIIHEVEGAINIPIEWKNGSIDVLAQRAGQIQQLAEVLWAMN